MSLKTTDICKIPDWKINIEPASENLIIAYYIITNVELGMIAHLNMEAKKMTYRSLVESHLNPP